MYCGREGSNLISAHGHLIFTAQFIEKTHLNCHFYHKSNIRYSIVSLSFIGQSIVEPTIHFLITTALQQASITGKAATFFKDVLAVSILCLVAQLCPTLCDSLDWSPPGSSDHGIFQARILDWVAISFSRGIFLTQALNLHLLHCRQILYPLSCWESPSCFHIVYYIYYRISLSTHTKEQEKQGGGGEPMTVLLGLPWICISIWRITDIFTVSSCTSTNNTYLPNCLDLVSFNFLCRDCTYFCVYS